MISPTLNTVLRGNDPTGHGYYGAKRGTRKHKGLDILTKPGEKLSVPFSGVITKIGQVYKETTKFKYVEITNDVYRTRLMYSKPISSISINKRVFKGEIYGIAQDIAGYWGGGMKNHVHMELWKHGLLTDPEPLIT